MNEKTIRVLEFDKIVRLLTSEAVSPMGREVLEKMMPTGQLYEVKEMLTETTEAVSVILRKGFLPFGHLHDIKKNVRYAEKGGALSMGQLLEISYNLRAATNTISFLKTEKEEAPSLWGMADVINTNKKLEDHINQCIISEDEMADTASPELRDIRRNIARQNEAVRSKMSSILSSSQVRDMLQDSVFTMRDGRFVIPVKQEHRVKFPGIVHDRSATGATVFIEPQAIVTLNNELRELELRERAEIQRILEELSSETGHDARNLINNQKVLTKLDVIFAKGRLSVKQGGTAAQINENGYISIRKGRHPLLDPEKVVPVSVELGKKYNTLIITGPNTGGKTVTLKTVGLMLLMNQCGLHVPAEDGTELPVMKKIFADIGDEQSIEQSLSTFSSHMGNIVEIVQNADKDTFIVIDELGAGTDPTEGAALAIAVLNYLYQTGARTMATTHYNELKKYALSTDGVENASMEFDVNTLSPTYRLTIGTPGRSNAFEISTKLGLKKEIVDRARTMIDRDDIRFEEVISKIEKDKIAAEQERDEAIMLKLRMAKKNEELQAYEEKLEQKKKKILENARSEAEQIVDDAKAFSDEVKQELSEIEREAIEARDLAKEAAAAVEFKDSNKRQQDIKQRIKKQKTKYKEYIEPVVNYDPVDVRTLKIGDTVRVLSLGTTGNVISLPDSRGDISVQVGLLKVSVKADDLTKIAEKSVQENFKKTKYGNLYRQKTSTISASINVIGKSLDEAIMLVDKYLDDAFMSGLPTVTVIHGRGEGILRNGLQNLFKRHKHVKEFRTGGYYEGGTGVTVIDLK